MENILSIYAARLMVDQLLEFLEKTAANIEKATPAVLHVEEEFAEFKPLVEALDRVSKSPRRKPATSYLEAYDADRDRKLGQVFSAARRMRRDRLHSSPVMLDNASKVILSFLGIQFQQYNKETMKIKELLEAIEREGLTDLVNQYGGENLVSALTEANDTFNRYMNTREDELGQQERFDRRELRQHAIRLYNRMMEVADVVSVKFSSAAADTFVQDQNGVILQFRDAASRLRYGGSENEKAPPRDDSPWEEFKN